MLGGHWQCPSGNTQQLESKERLVTPGVCPYCEAFVSQERLDLDFFHCMDCADLWVADRSAKIVLVLNHKSNYHPIFIEDSNIVWNARR